MKRFVLATCCLAGLLLCLPYSCISAGPSPIEGPGAAAGISKEPFKTGDMRDPSAIAELKRATNFLVSLPRFHVRASVTYDVHQEDGRLLQFEKIGDIYLQRPDRFFCDIRFDDGRWRQRW
ncbi:MAG: DUF2092 domain-containing protein [Desulfobacteraceae bacterium]|nr:MAG: DUF2092 domain-containing protein [Desulfobacteraceae bacterium]